MYLSRNGAAAWAENSAQCGHVWLAYSTSLTGALGLPTTIPPIAVSDATCAQRLPAGGLIAAVAPAFGGSCLAGWLGLPRLPQATSTTARTAARIVKRARKMLVIGSGSYCLLPGQASPWLGTKEDRPPGAGGFCTDCRLPVPWWISGRRRAAAPARARSTRGCRPSSRR